MPDSTEITHRCYMDGIDWQHHLEADAKGTPLFPSVKSLKELRTCIDPGGCGVVEVEVRLIRWIEEQDLDRPCQELTDAASDALERQNARCTRCHGTGWVGLPSGWVTRVGVETIPCPDCASGSDSKATEIEAEIAAEQGFYGSVCDPDK